MPLGGRLIFCLPRLFLTFAPISHMKGHPPGLLRGARGLLPPPPEYSYCKTTQIYFLCGIHYLSGYTYLVLSLHLQSIHKFSLSGCLFVCWLFVCLYPINVKTAEPTRPKFFEGSRVTPGRFMNDQN